MDVGLSQLLSSLGLGRAPALSGRPGSDSSGEIDFAKLLEEASAGKVRSERPVTAVGGVLTGAELTADQLARLSTAADQAEAKGVTTAMVLIDGRALKLDVGARRITGELNADRGSGGALAGIDGVVAVPSAGGGAAGLAQVAPVAVGATGAAPSALGNPSLAALLGSLAERARQLEEPPAPGEWGQGVANRAGAA